MSRTHAPSLSLPEESPTRVRYTMVLLATLVAVLLYLDRVCLSTAAREVRADLQLDELQWSWVLGVFFLSYALAQLPAGWLGDRFGARAILTFYIVSWSLVTGLQGLATSLTAMVVFRLGIGLFEAGAYPVAAGIVRRWIPPRSRGLASSVVSVGGRLGGALAPIVTVGLMNSWMYFQGPESQNTSWRPVMLFYGLLGILIAGLFYLFYRDSPGQHSAVNAAERELIGPTSVDRSIQTLGLPPFGKLLGSIGLWANSFVQFATNLGWAFLVTALPNYLAEAHNASLEQRGWGQSLPLLAGALGLLAGGWVTDWCYARLGQYRGRMLPILLSRLVVGLAFLACPFMPSYGAVLLIFVLVSFATDMGVGAMWAYGLDIGGRHVGSVFGWANMWGNFGAFASPLLFGLILSAFPENKLAGWNLGFFVCAAVQGLACLAALWIDARRPLEPEPALVPTPTSRATVVGIQSRPDR